jgi:hypothetical protein
MVGLIDLHVDVLLVCLANDLLWIPIVAMLEVIESFVLIHEEVFQTVEKNENASVT